MYIDYTILCYKILKISKKLVCYLMLKYIFTCDSTFASVKLTSFLLSKSLICLASMMQVFCANKKVICVNIKLLHYYIFAYFMCLNIKIFLLNKYYFNVLMLYICHLFCNIILLNYQLFLITLNMIH